MLKMTWGGQEGEKRTTRPPYMKTTELTPSAHKPVQQSDESTEAARIKPQRLKLGIDVHCAQYTVVAQFDGASPRPAQRFTPEALSCG